MEMVAASKMRKAVNASLISKSYVLSALNILVNISKSREIKHPFFLERNSGKILMIIITSNKGLAGAYNLNVSRAVKNFIENNNSNTEIEAITIGKQSEKITNRFGIKIIDKNNDISDLIEDGDTDYLFNKVDELFLAKKSQYKKVFIAHTQFVKKLEYKAKIEQILPAEIKTLNFMLSDHEITVKNKKNPYTFEPDSETINSNVVPELIRSIFRQVILDAFASEHSSRMVAMKNAGDNAGRLQDELKLSYNKARQAAVTQEIAEISAGANALL